MPLAPTYLIETRIYLKFDRDISKSSQAKPKEKLNTHGIGVENGCENWGGVKQSELTPQAGRKPGVATRQFALVASRVSLHSRVTLLVDQKSERAFLEED
jgi:hypothetical protein